MAAWLSQYSFIVLGKTPKEGSNDLTQSSSLVTVAIAQYYASTKDPDTALCFFVFQEIADPPNVT